MCLGVADEDLDVFGANVNDLGNGEPPGCPEVSLWESPRSIDTSLSWFSTRKRART